MVNQHAAGTLNLYPNLIELIGHQSELSGTAVWWEQAIGSDELSDGAGLDPLPAPHDNILQDEINGPSNAVSVSDHEVIGQDEFGSPLAKQDRMSICSDETIGQDEIQSPPAYGLDRLSICNDESFLQDEAADIAYS